MTHDREFAVHDTRTPVGIDPHATDLVGIDEIEELAVFERRQTMLLDELSKLRSPGLLFGLFRLLLIELEIA